MYKLDYYNRKFPLPYEYVTEGSVDYIKGIRENSKQQRKHAYRIKPDNQSTRKEIQKHRDEFMIMASHELRTPVTSLKVYLDVLRKELNINQKKYSVYYINKMDSQLNKLSNLIEEILDISRLQSGKLKLNKELIDINKVLKNTINQLKPAISNHKISVRGKTDQLLWGDKYRLEQVVTNLLTNAVRYSPGAKIVKISVKRMGPSICIGVKDYGIGIPKQYQKKIFGRFYRIPGNFENTFPGMGIGLYISREIVRRHGGKLWVDSREGKGSEFNFTLPIKRGTLLS